MAFAAGWTPCIGPILGGIYALAAASDSLGRGVLLLAAYSALLRGAGEVYVITRQRGGQIGHGR